MDTFRSSVLGSGTVPALTDEIYEAIFRGRCPVQSSARPVMGRANTDSILVRLWRLLNPVFDWRRSVVAIRNYPDYFTQLSAFRRLGGHARVVDLYPQLHDRTYSSPFDFHYFYQDTWAAQRVATVRPEHHIDVGSRIDLVGFLTALTRVVFVDIRPLDARVDNLQFVEGSILSLPFESQSVSSISCLHVAEHIGLGRYGDELDPEGMRKAAGELSRVLAPGGNLLFGCPVGRERVMFNAHRITPPSTVVSMFSDLDLIEHSGVDDAGNFAVNRRLDELASADYACGLFMFRRCPD